jgi:hypothetical protein
MIVLSVRLQNHYPWQRGHASNSSCREKTFALVHVLALASDGSIRIRTR